MAEKNVHIDPAQIKLQRDIINSIKERLGGQAMYAMVETYGCQQNVNDSQRIEGMLMEMGFSLTNEREKADVIIFNNPRERTRTRIRKPWRAQAFKGEKALPHYRYLRLHGAAGAYCKKGKIKIPPCGFDFRHTRFVEAAAAFVRCYGA